MDRRKLLSAAIAITGGTVMSGTAATPDDLTDPANLEREFSIIRGDFTRRGARIVGDGEKFAGTVSGLEHDRITRGDVKMADAYAKISADLSQWLALAHLKTGAVREAEKWATRAFITARGADLWDLAAVAQCRRSGILKTSDPTRAYEVLNAVATLPLSPWAKTFVAQHQAAVLVRYGPGWQTSALGKMDQAEKHLNDAIKTHGGDKRPWWAGGAERPLSITYTGIDYRRAEIMLNDSPAYALKLLTEQVLGDTSVDGFSRAGVQIRQATAAYALDWHDDAAHIALEAWNLLAPAGLRRDTDRIRKLANLLGQSSDGAAVRDLTAAIKG